MKKTLKQIKEKDKRVRALCDELGRICRAKSYGRADAELARQVIGSSNKGHNEFSTVEQMREYVLDNQIGYGSNKIYARVGDTDIGIAIPSNSKFSNQAYTQAQRYYYLLDNKPEYLEYFNPVYQLKQARGDKLVSSDDKFINKTAIVTQHAEVFSYTSDLIERYKDLTDKTDEEIQERLDAINSILSELGYYDFQIENLGIIYNYASRCYDIVCIDYGAIF